VRFSENGGFVRMSVTRRMKMLRHARMAAMRKLRRGIGHIGQRRLWAGSVGYDCAYFRRLARPLASVVLPKFQTQKAAR
jgi:hypothetical protein